MKYLRLFPVSLLLILAFSTTLWAQDPSWNRKLQAIAVTPDVAGGSVVSVALTIDAQPTSVPLSVATEAVLLVNGVQAASPVMVDATFNLVTIPCGLSTCSGICGDATVDGGAVSLVCYEDCPWHASVLIDGDCDCGLWRSATFPPVTLVTGDEIMVLLRPAPGALPDSDASDDTTRTTPDGEVLYWNRSVDSATMFEVGAGLYDIVVSGDASFNGPETVNLDFDMVVLHNGTEVAAQPVTMRGERNATDPTCFQVGCGNFCGVMNGSSRSCLEAGPWNTCSCTAGYLEVIPGVPMPSLQPGDEIMVLLRPAPGAFPEIPDAQFDDTFIVPHPQPEDPSNRKVQNIAVTPAAITGWDIAVHWTADAQPTSVPLNLSTQFELWINGSLTATSPGVGVTFNQVTIPCGVGSCSGICGDATVGGQAAALICYEDCPWHATPGIQDCDCGVWLNYQFPTVPALEPEDEIMVLLRPAPGALPDSDSADDTTRVTFDGGEIFWNRGITDVELTFLSGGTYDVEVRGSTTWEMQIPAQSSVPPTANLDFDLGLLLNGVEVETQRVEMRVTGGTDISCFQLGCGNYCGSMNGLDRNCDPSGPWGGCRCGGSWIHVFSGVLPGASSDDDIQVILRPVPGALPELPGIPEDDDERDGVVVGVGDDMVRVSLESLLGQNRPNPFNPATSIPFIVPERTHARLEIFDVQGKRVLTLVDEVLDAGEHVQWWNGVDRNGTQAASGIYYYRLSVAGRIETRKMVLLK